MAQGEILLAAQRGDMLSEGVGLDADARPTTDPHAVLGGGSILPFGRHKGSSIAFMIEIIAGSEIYERRRMALLRCLWQRLAMASR
jgi:delta1-piperideine-2-carboxylate reductase